MTSNLSAAHLLSDASSSRIAPASGLILTLAPTGPTYPTHRYPSIPADHDELVADCCAAHRVGFRSFHIHARNPSTGQQFSDRGYYERAFDAIRAIDPAAVVGGATSRKGEVELQISQRIRRIQHGLGNRTLSAGELADAELAVRGAALSAYPDRITTFTPPEIKMTDSVGTEDYLEITKSYSDLTKRSWKRPDVMRRYYQKLRAGCLALGVVEELEITSDVAFPVVERIAADSALGLPAYVGVLFLFGYSARLPVDRRAFERAMRWVERLERLAGITASVTVGAAISPHAAGLVERSANTSLELGKHDYREVFDWVVGAGDRVSSFRVGLEDVPVLHGQPATNYGLASHARSLCDEYGVRVVTDPLEVRSRLLTGPAVSTSRYRPVRVSSLDSKPNWALA